MNKTAKTTFHIKTFGCQMNVYDSGKMADMLIAHGYSQTDDPHTADVLIFNTCHIREKASDKLFSELGTVRNLPSIKVVAGCVAQAQDELITKRAPFVDIIVGPLMYHKLPELLQRKQKSVATEFPFESKFEFLPPRTGRSKFSEFIAVQEGCDRFCSYCVVPYTRGVQYSRPPGEILSEARRLVSGGAKEITLLGQNVNAYNGDGKPLEYLFYKLAEMDGLLRIRYTTSYPGFMTKRLMAAHKEIPALMPFLHLPVQSGSNRILRAMNRKYTVEQYVETIDKMKDIRPDMAVSSDFITGFPGESEDDFQQTLDLLKKASFASYFAFKFSARPGTVAADMPDQVDESVKASRLARLQKLLNQQRLKFNTQFIGKTLPVLMTGETQGYSPYMQIVNIKGLACKQGDMIDIKISKAGVNSLVAGTD